MSNMKLDKIIEKNKEKALAKQEKRGIYQNQIREAAAMKTRTMQGTGNTVDYREVDSSQNAYSAPSSAKPGSMAAKANMVREYNERNSRK